MLKRFFKPETFRRGIVLSSAANVVGQGMAFLSSATFAYFFGTQENTDVYFFAMAAIYSATCFIGNINTIVLIPESMRLMGRLGQDAAMRFLNFFLYLLLGVAALFTAIAYIAPISLFGALSQFSATQLESHRVLLLWAIPYFGLQLVGQYLLDVLFSFRYFTLPIFFALFNRTLLFVGLLMLAQPLGLLAAVFSTLAGLVIQILLCGRLLRSKLGWKPAASRSHVTRAVWSDIGWSLTGNLANTIAGYVPVYMMSGFSAGMLTAMSYAQRLFAIPGQLITSQVATVIGIKFNDCLAHGDTAGAGRAHRRASTVLLALLVPLSLFLCIYAREVVAVLFERGSFSETSVDQAALFFRILVLNLPLVATSTLVVNLFFACRLVRQSIGYKLMVNALMAAGIVLAVRTCGPVGYPVSVVVVDSINVLVLLSILAARITPFLEYGRTLRALAAAVLAATVPAALLWLLRGWMIPHGPVAALAAGVVACAAMTIATAPLHPAGRGALQEARRGIPKLMRKATSAGAGPDEAMRPGDSGPPPAP
jgi:peptidoglycan biosynthesis protein MviN/MurJ (putative lipid II flippase)